MTRTVRPSGFDSQQRPRRALHGERSPVPDREDGGKPRGKKGGKGKKGEGGEKGRGSEAGEAQSRGPQARRASVRRRRGPTGGGRWKTSMLSDGTEAAAAARIETARERGEEGERGKYTNKNRGPPLGRTGGREEEQE